MKRKCYKVKHTILWGFFMLFCFLLFLANPLIGHNVQAEDIVLDNQISGSVNSPVSFTVSVNNAPNDVDTFGFEILFDPNILQYKGYERGGLVKKFDVLDISIPDPQRLVIGGFTTSNKIEDGSSGTLVILEFSIKKAGSESVLSLMHLKDDMKDWSTKEGRLTISTGGDTLIDFTSDLSESGCFINVCHSKK